jgi:hypothetical protein
MKRTEIIIETRRVTVIQHRNRSTEAFSGAFAGEIETNDQTDAGQHETGNDDIPGEDKEQCIDSRNR